MQDEGEAQPIAGGSCTGHHGRTLHYTRGNSSDQPRIAYIVNFRPKAMIEYERKNNYDHGLQVQNNSLYFYNSVATFCTEYFVVVKGLDGLLDTK